MKLRDLDILVTAPPAPGWGGRYWIFVKLTTDDGITGWGECYASTVGQRRCARSSRTCSRGTWRARTPRTSS
jgi:L-alanine-DL-glutamate epimerase-like enolase superfamily enzyme